MCDLKLSRGKLTHIDNRRVFADLKERDPELFEQAHLFSSFFYKKLSTKDRYVQSQRDAGQSCDGCVRHRPGDDPYLSVRKWTSKVDIFSKKYIIIPINEQ